jgi:nucleotide-binding universal stress UspA family protein
MFSTILMPVDDLELAGRILWQVKRLLEREGGAVTLLRAVPTPGAWARAIESGVAQAEHALPRRLERARHELLELKERLEAEGVNVASVEVHAGDPADVILRAATRLSPSLVAMASNGRTGASRFILGSVAERVLRECVAPLFLCNPEFVGTPGGRAFCRILVPLDGSKNAEAILPQVEAFAALHGAEVILLHVGALTAYAPPTLAGPMGFSLPAALPEPESTAELDRRVAGPRDRLRQAGLRVRTLTPLSGNVASEILARAESEGADLVAMTTHGHSGLDRWLFGSVAEKVLRNCPTPLLVKRVAGPVRAPRDRESLDEEALASAAP